MKKMVMYGNEKCPDCVAAKEVLDREGIRYGYVDILAGLAHLKKFMVIRDSHPEIFTQDACKDDPLIGIPTFVVEDKDVYIDVNQLDFEDLRK